MTGPTLITPPKPLSKEQIEVIDMIKELLAIALEGQITTIGIVGCRGEGFFSAMRGRQAADLNLACDELKKRILDEVLDTTTERQTRRSSILRN